MKLFSYKRENGKIRLCFFGIKASLKTKPPQFIKNYFKTNYEKKALLVYVLDYFLGNKHICHSNATESYIAGETLSKLGYNVDILHWQEAYKTEFYSKYDVVYGKNLRNAIFSKAKVIPYSGGAALKNANKQSVERAYEFYKKAQVPALSSLCNTLSISRMFTYANIILGNNVTKDSFIIDGLEKEQNLYNIEAFYFDTYNIDLSRKDFKEARKHFLWWGSRGSIHKGLDLVIDVFKERKDLTLHICGFNQSETEFLEFYKEELTNKIPNIINHGFVNMESDLFKEIMNKCAALIFPSISEGGSPASLNVMANGGLIPIVSKNSGIDIEQYGFMLERLNIKTINLMIDKLLALNEDEIINLSTRVKNETRERYTIENYRNNLLKILKEILND